MEALQKDIMASDSEDEDYVPPENAKPNNPGISIRKGGIVLEDDDDDSLSDDADEVDREVLGLFGDEGAGASGAGSAAGSAAVPSGAGSSAAGASGAGSSGAGDEKAPVASDAGSGAVAGASAGNETKAPEQPASVATAEKEATMNDVSVEKSSETPKPAAVPSSEEQKLEQAEEPGKRAVEQPPNEAPPAKKPRVERTSPVPEAEPESNKVVHNKKNSIDDIWAQMNAGMKATSAQKPVASQKQADDMGLTGWLGTSATPKPTEVKQTHGFKVRRLEDLEADAAAEAEAQRKDASSNAQSQAKRPRSGLEDVLDIVRGGPKSQVMHATREKWTEYKKDEAVDDELETYKRGKDRYTDKVAFLARSDVREWEFEQKGRKGRR